MLTSLLSQDGIMSQGSDTIIQSISPDYKITRLQNYNVFFLIDDPNHIKNTKENRKISNNINKNNSH